MPDDGHTSDAEQRDKELDADGVSAEVIFADSDAITGKESPPFGAGLSAGEIRDPELAFAGARAHNRFLVELCRDRGLVTTASSDFHGPSHKMFNSFGAYSTYDLGEPELPSWRFCDCQLRFHVVIALQRRP